MRHDFALPPGFGAQASEAAVSSVVVGPERAGEAVERRGADQHLHGREMRRRDVVARPLIGIGQHRAGIGVVGLLDRGADHFARNRARSVDGALGVEARIHAVAVRRRVSDDVVGAFDLRNRVVVVDRRPVEHLRERLDRMAEALRVRALRRVPDSHERRPVHVGGQLHEPARDGRVEAHIRPAAPPPHSRFRRAGSATRTCCGTALSC